MCSELVFHKRHGKGRTVNTYAAQALVLKQKPGQGADVIFMTVGEHDAQNRFSLGKYGLQPGNDDIDAEQGIVGKHQAAVYQHYALVGLPLLAVHADFAESPQRGYGQVRFSHGRKILCFF